MDTEGLGSTSRSSTHDSRIFALALLLSSYFIYNSRGVIDGQALEDLSLVASLTQVIQSKSSRGSANSGNLDDDSSNSTTQAFPIFVWVLRDFTLKLEDDQGKKISSNQYLEHCLKPQAGFSDAITSKNQIRRLISESFRERECVTFVRPAEDEAVLRNLSQYRLEELRPEFTKQMKQFLTKVANGVRPKQILGRTLNGEMFATLLLSYTEALNSGEVPEINSAWTRVISTQCNEAKQNALDFYDSLIFEELSKNKTGLERKKVPFPISQDSVLPVDFEMLFTAHERVKSKSKHEFRTKLIDPYEETPRHVSNQLKVELRLRLEGLIDKNMKASQSKSTKKLQVVLENARSDGGKGNSIQSISERLDKYRLILNELETMIGSNTENLGPIVWDVQNQYLGGKMLEDVSSWASTTAEYFRSTETILTKDFHELEITSSTLQATVTTKEAMFKQQELSDERTEGDLRERIEEEKTRFEEDIKRKDVEAKRYQEMLKDLMEMHTSTMEAMTTRQKDLRLKLEAEREAVINEQKKLGSDRSTLKTETKSADELRQQEKDQLQASVEKQTAHVRELKRELEQVEFDHTKALNKRSEEYFKEISTEKARIEKDQRALESQLDTEYERDQKTKQNEIKEMSDLIRTKENQLRRLGVVVESSLPENNGTNNVTTQTAAPKAGKRGSTKPGKGEKGGGCKQS